MSEQNKPLPGKFLTFVLDRQHYGVQISSVREINQMLEITPLPQAPDYMAGVINLRGKLIPVVNLRQRLGMPAIDSDRQTCIIVLDSSAGFVGVIVDAVSDVADLTAEMIEVAPRMLGQGESDYVVGMGKTEQRVIIILDTELLLGSEVMRVLSENGALEQQAA